MDRPAPAQFRLRPDWPGAPAPRDAARDAEVARQFETLIAETLLRSARASSLGDDGLGASGDTGGDHVRAMIDHAHAEAIARAAPMGVARLLAAERRGT
ncbi:MAG: hypothetical protein RL490_1409 [Pseudomonadota bacterium]|jgi:Rod binding domain-containing protein